MTVSWEWAAHIIGLKASILFFIKNLVIGKSNGLKVIYISDTPISKYICEDCFSLCILYCVFLKNSKMG